MTDLPPGIESRLKDLPQGLRDHIERARETAQELALRHGVDAALADLGTAAHDLARALKADALLEQARHYRLRVGSVERSNPVLLHGPVAAMWLEREIGIDDPRVLEAVRWHTTGKQRLGPVAKVVFLADKLEPHKVERYPYLRRVKSLAERSLDRALLEFVNRELEYLLRKGHPIHPGSLALRNELIATLDDGPG